MRLQDVSGILFALIIGLTEISQANSGFACHPDERAPELLATRDAIISKALANTTNEAGFAEIRQELDQMISELQKYSPTPSLEVISQFSPGSWRQIWSDEANNDQPGGPKRQLDRIYQYVSAEGWGFNFGVRVLPNSNAVTFALKVKAEVSSNIQTTEITEAYLRTSPIYTGESLANISNRIHKFPDLKGGYEFERRNAGRFPNGPIGASGTLELIYLDDVVKIGKGPNVYTGKSELYIMLRQDRIE